MIKLRGIFMEQEVTAVEEIQTLLKVALNINLDNKSKGSTSLNSASSMTSIYVQREILTITIIQWFC